MSGLKLDCDAYVRGAQLQKTVISNKALVFLHCHKQKKKKVKYLGVASFGVGCGRLMIRLNQSRNLILALFKVAQLEYPKSSYM